MLSLQFVSFQSYFTYLMTHCGLLMSTPSGLLIDCGNILSCFSRLFTLSSFSHLLFLFFCFHVIHALLISIYGISLIIPLPCSCSPPSSVPLLSLSCFCLSVLFLAHFYDFSTLNFLHLLFQPVPSLHVRPQALLVRALLEYSQSSECHVPYGLSLVAGIFLMELMRSWSLALMWAVNYRTAARLRGAALTFAFNKILRLRSTKDIGPGEVGDKSLEGTRLQIN